MQYARNVSRGYDPHFVVAEARDRTYIPGEMSGTTVYANLYGKRRRLIFSRVGDRSGLDRRLPHVRGHPLLDAGRSQQTPINVCICVAVESTRALNTSDEPVFLL